jgi:pyruvate carboxylase subunit B
MKYVTIINDQRFEIDIQRDGSLLVNGEVRTVDFLALGPSLYSMLMDDQSYETVIDEHDGEVRVQLRGRQYTSEVLDERAQLLGSSRVGLEVTAGELTIKSPMPGLVLDVPVHEGQEVAQGTTVIVLESMKMQNELKAPRDGVILRIMAQAGQSVEQGKPLIALG